MCNIHHRFSWRWVTIFAALLAENDWEIAHKAQGRGLFEIFRALTTVSIFGNLIFVVYLHFMLNLKPVALSLIWQAGRII